MADSAGPALYSSRASVFRINPETRSSWLPIGETAIPISFVASPVSADSKNLDGFVRRELKIIGTNERDGSVIFEALLLPKTLFQQRSQKFCQWVDHTQTLYGLGFGSEQELHEFLETFKRLQRDILLQPAPHGRPMGPVHPQPRTSGPVDDKSYRDLEQKQHNTNSQSETTNGRSSTAGASNSSWGLVEATQPDQQEQNSFDQAKRQLMYQGPVTAAARGVISMNGGSGGSGGGNYGADRNNNNVSSMIAKSGHDESSANYSRSQSMFGLEGRARSGSRGNMNTNSSTSNLNVGRASPVGVESSPIPQSDWQKYDQLKYENERLKQALEESAKNAVEWDKELKTLRTNNLKLTQALQESKINVEQWVRELSNLRDENKELKIRMMEMGSSNEPENSNEQKVDLQKYKSFAEEAQIELKRKQAELDQLQRSMEEMRLQSNGNPTGDLSQHKQRLDMINARLEAKLSELVDVQKDFSNLLNKLHQ